MSHPVFICCDAYDERSTFALRASVTLFADGACAEARPRCALRRVARTRGEGCEGGTRTLMAVNHRI